MLPIPLPTAYLQIPDFLSGGKGGFTPVVVVHVARAKSLVGSLLVLLMFAQGSSIGFNISIRGEHTQWASDQWQHLKRGNRYLDSNLVAFPNRMDGHMRFYADFVKSFHLWLCFVFFPFLHLLYRAFHLVGFTYPSLLIPFYPNCNQMRVRESRFVWHGGLILWVRSCFMQETIHMVWASVPEGLPTQILPLAGICLWLLLWSIRRWFALKIAPPTGMGEFRGLRPWLRQKVVKPTAC